MRLPHQAVAWLRKEAKSRTTAHHNMCKRLARIASGVDSDGTPDATTAWKKTKHRGTTPAKTAPLGAKIWWTTGDHGHVITSNGKGGGLGNYWKDAGRVRELSMSTWNKSMGGVPAGWSYDIDGVVVVPLPKLSKPPVKAPQPPVVSKPAPTIPAQPKPTQEPPVLEPSKPSEPLLTRAAVTAAVTAVVSVLAVFGVFIPAGDQEAVVNVLLLCSPLVALVTAWWSRSHVTPVVDPRAEDGSPLVRLLRPLVKK